MTRIISFVNHKGGVGKTTTTVNLGAGLNNANKRVLLVDLDPQTNLSQSLGYREPSEQTVYEAMKGNLKHLPIINIKKGFDIVLSSLDLSGADIEFSNIAGRDFILKDLLEGVKENYDFILIDCPPSLNVLTLNALTASTDIIIPVEAEYLAMQGINKLSIFVEMVQKRTNKELKLLGVLLTKYDSRKVLNRTVGDALKGHFEKDLFNTIIRDNVALAETPSAGQDIFSYNPKSSGAEDYKTLTKELLKKIH